MSLKEKIIPWYERNVKKLALVTFVIVLLALGQIVTQYIQTGEFVQRGVSLKGGSTITINQPYPVVELQQQLQEQFPGADITVRSITQGGRQIGVAVDADAQEQQEITGLVDTLTQTLQLGANDYTVEIIGTSLGKSFFRQTMTALVVAFVLMAIVVLIYFRTIVPSMAVLAAAFSDLVITLAVFNLLGMRLTTSGIAAFLMLIGYSVDTDMLLSTKGLKRTDQQFIDRVISAIKTGMMMTGTALIVIIVAIIFIKSAVIKQIMVILLIGLITDIFMTWIQNVGILKWYLERGR